MLKKHLILQNKDIQIPISFKKSNKAKRIILRINQKMEVELVVPKRTSENTAIKFLYGNQEWLFNKLAQIKPQTQNKLQHGSVINVIGRSYTIFHTGKLRGVTDFNGDIISVAGEENFISRKIQDFLRSTVKNEIKKIADSYCQIINVKYQNITLRDTKSRWGSCSHNGNLSFSWRLVFAPYEVLRYVVIHELAHLREMNHSQNFWDIVERSDPDYKKHRKWLKTNGSKLHSYLL